MSITTPPAHARLDGIQVLRAIAALLVLVFHTAALLRETLSDTEAYPGLWDQGWIGVDLFFVISGFIMVHVTRDMPAGVKSMGQFIWRRTTRIYPLWWLCAGLMSAYFFVQYGIPAAPDRVESGGGVVSHVARSFLLLPQDPPPVLGLGWSLVHEMYFYVVFAVCLFLPARLRIWAVLLWGFVSLNAYFWVGDIHLRPGWVEVMANPISLYFVFGACLRWAMDKADLSSRALWSLLGLAGVIALIHMGVKSAWLLGDPSSHAGYGLRVAFFLPVLGAMVFAFSKLDLGQGRIVRNLARVGDWSYALYLSHLFVLLTLSRLSMRFLQPQDWGLALVLVFVTLCVFGSLLLAAALHYGFERPVMRLFRRPRAPARSRG